MPYLPSTPELSALVERYRVAKLSADAAVELSNETRDALKLAMLESAGDVAPSTTNPLDVSVGPVTAHLSVVESWRLDTTRIKREQPEVYAAYAKMSTALKLELKV